MTIIFGSFRTGQITYEHTLIRQKNLEELRKYLEKKEAVGTEITYDMITEWYVFPSTRHIRSPLTIFWPYL